MLECEEVVLVCFEYFYEVESVFGYVCLFVDERFEDFVEEDS